MAIVVLTVNCYCHVFMSATTYISMQCKREAVVYDDGAGHGLYHTEILFVEDTCVKKYHTKFNKIVICILI